MTEISCLKICKFKFHWLYYLRYVTSHSDFDVGLANGMIWVYGKLHICMRYDDLYIKVPYLFEVVVYCLEMYISMLFHWLYDLGVE